jgi:DNA gyrase subunit B
VDFVVQHRLIETDAGSLDDLVKAMAGLGENGFELSLVEQAADELRVRVVERDTSAAADVAVPAQLLVSMAYASLRRAYARLVEVAGSPPFQLSLGKKEKTAETFAALREDLLELARDGLSLTRFKGLGEMNPEQLWETTMDPARRMLLQVSVEDTSAADDVFSMLMGDKVEPRRDFIESNAREVRFLDV